MAMLRSTNIAIMIIIIVILIVVIVVVEISLFWECVYIINRNHIESTSLLLYFGIPFFALHLPPSPSFCFAVSVSSSFQNSHRARYCVALFSLDKFRKFWGCSMNINFEINVDFVFVCACCVLRVCSTTKRVRGPKSYYSSTEWLASNFRAIQ